MSVACQKSRYWLCAVVGIVAADQVKYLAKMSSANQQNVDAVDILTRIGNLYLNEDFSDVVFMIGEEKLPAHQVILGQSCAAFKKLFLKERSEPKNQTIVLSSEAPLEAFKQFLKFIYTGSVKFDKLTTDGIFEVLDLAKKHEMPRLQQVCVDRLETVCTIDTVGDFINKAVKRAQESLLVLCLTYVTVHPVTFVKHASFKKLSAEALRCVLRAWQVTFALDRSLNAPHKEVFKSFVEWMKANPDESANFSELLKSIELRTMAIDDVVSAIRPLNLIDSKDLIDIVYEQAKQVVIPGGNVLSPHTGAEVTSGGPPFFFTMPNQGFTLKHMIDDGFDGITIDLKRSYMLNHFEMELLQPMKCYWIDVSEDNVHWTRVIDYSKYTCTSVQNLYFTERAVRFIRIYGTNVFMSHGDFFEVLRLEAYYKKQPLAFDPETGIIIPSENVVMLGKHVILHEDKNAPAIKAPGIVQLPQPYLLDSIKLLLCTDEDETAFQFRYSYTIEVSTDSVHWTKVVSEENVSSLRHARFDRQPVVFIKLTPTFASHGCFFWDFIECFANIDIKKA